MPTGGTGVEAVCLGEYHGKHCQRGGTGARLSPGSGEEGKYPCVQGTYHARSGEKWGWEICKYPHYENVGVEDLTFVGYAKPDFRHHGNWRMMGHTNRFRCHGSRIPGYGG